MPSAFFAWVIISCELSMRENCLQTDSHSCLSAFCCYLVEDDRLEHPFQAGEPLLGLLNPHAPGQQSQKTINCLTSLPLHYHKESLKKTQTNVPLYTITSESLLIPCIITWSSALVSLSCKHCYKMQSFHCIR